MSDEERAYYDSKSKRESQVAATICFLACVALLAVYGLISMAHSLFTWMAS